MNPPNTPDLEQLVYDRAIRLEITMGIPLWEASPSPQHQITIDLIRSSIEPLPGSEPGCMCAHLSDVSIRFPDGSIKRPDIALFCTRPPYQVEALTDIPPAIIEIISPGYEYKDFALNPPFYLAQGVQDVVIVDPRTGIVIHHRTTAAVTHHAPVTLTFQCGCRCTIPAGSPPPAEEK